MNDKPIEQLWINTEATVENDPWNANEWDLLWEITMQRSFQPDDLDEPFDAMLLRSVEAE